MRFCRLFLCVGLLLAGGAPLVRAATPDDLYLEAYRLIQEGDNLRESGRKNVARQRYEAAQSNLQKLKNSYPSYNKTAVDYRLNYLQRQISEIPEPAKDAPATEVKSQPGGRTPTDGSQGAQQRIAELESENQMLQAKLQEALSARPAAVDPGSLAEAEERIKQLQKEKELLRANLQKVEASKPEAGDAAMLAQARGELEATRARLAEAVASIATLTRELQEAKTGEASADELKQRVTELEKERDELKAELARKQEGASTAPNNSADQARVKELENERDALLKRLSEASSKKGQSSQAEATANQIRNLRARLEVFEARKVPYTEEELALLDESGPGPRLAANVNPKEGKRSIRELPSGSGLLVSEAERAFAARRLDEAEAKYQQVLEMDPRNPVTLANLSAIQIEMNKLDEAEANLKRAIAADPEDSYALLLMGMVHLRRDNFQEALDQLSRAVQLDPKNAEAQNYVGVTLSQLGQREAAETALRKAIMLKPNYPGAHHNLAFIYATQRPPATELAKFHYQKAVSMGHPANPELEKELKLTP